MPRTTFEFSVREIRYLINDDLVRPIFLVARDLYMQFTTSSGCSVIEGRNVKSCACRKFIVNSSEPVAKSAMDFVTRSMLPPVATEAEHYKSISPAVHVCTERSE